MLIKKIIKKKKYSVLLFLTLFLLVGYIYFYVLPTNKNKKYNTVKAKINNIIETAEAVGYIKPRNVISIKSQVSGIVEELYHDEGDYVKKGEPLLKIKPNPEPENYAAVYQNFIKSKRILESEKNNLTRYEKALKEKLITEDYSEYINSKKNYAIAEEDLLLAKQRLELLKNGTITVGGEEVENVVLSPIEGFILYKAVDSGDSVISLSSYQSSTILFTMADMKNVLFDGKIDEMDASKAKLGMPAEITVGAFPDLKIDGLLSKIGLQSDRENSIQGAGSAILDGSPFNIGFSVKIDKLAIPNNKKIKLRSGYSATAKIKLNTKKNVLTVPERVVYFDKEKSYVYVPYNNKTGIKKENIEILSSDGINVEVISGLREGMEIIDDPTIVTSDDK